MLPTPVVRTDTIHRIAGWTLPKTIRGEPFLPSPKPLIISSREPHSSSDLKEDYLSIGESNACGLLARHGGSGAAVQVALTKPLGSWHKGEFVGIE